MFGQMKQFLQESKQEFRHINWPTFAETRRLTFIVIALSLVVATLLGLLDFIFTSLLTKFFIS
jgi:preprotein translocase SecE subunit